MSQSHSLEEAIINSVVESCNSYVLRPISIRRKKSSTRADVYNILYNNKLHTAYGAGLIIITEETIESSGQMVWSGQHKILLADPLMLEKAASVLAHYCDYRVIIGLWLAADRNRDSHARCQIIAGYIWVLVRLLQEAGVRSHFSIPNSHTAELRFGDHYFNLAYRSGRGARISISYDDQLIDEILSKEWHNIEVRLNVLIQTNADFELLQAEDQRRIKAIKHQFKKIMAKVHIPLDELPADSRF